MWLAEFALLHCVDTDLLKTLTANSIKSQLKIVGLIIAESGLGKWGKSVILDVFAPLSVRTARGITLKL